MDKKHNNPAYSFFLSDNYNMSLNVAAIGKSLRNEKIDWFSSPVDFYTLHYISKGKGVYSQGKNSFNVEEKDVIIIFSGKPAQLTVTSVPYIHYWINFKGIDIQNLLSYTNITRETPVLKVNKDLTGFFESLYKEQGPEPYRQAQILSRLYSLFAVLMKNSANNKKIDYKKYYISKFITYIEENYSNNILVSDIAHYVGFSTSQLYRVVSEEFGVSPVKFLTDYRIKKAKSLLKQPDIKINVVAKQCGFSDSLYFSKTFSRYTGMTPTEYRDKTES